MSRIFSCFPWKMTLSHRRAATGNALSACLLMTLMTLMTFVRPAAGADDADATVHATLRFDLPAQPLDTALVAFGEATGYSVLVSSQLAAGRVAASVRGDYTPAEALQRLLAGTQLGARFSGSKAFTLLALADAPVAPAPVPAEAVPAAPPLQGYAAILQRSLTRALCRLHPDAFGRYRLAFQLWLDERGRVRAVHVLRTERRGAARPRRAAAPAQPADGWRATGRLAAAADDTADAAARSRRRLRALPRLGRGTLTMPDLLKTTLRKLFLERYGQFRRHLQRRLGSEDLANDALHETYLRVERMNVPEAISYPSAYLMRIAINIAEDQRRDNARLLSLPDIDDLYEMADELADPARTFSARAELEELERALQELPKRRRAIVIAARVDQLPHRDIAERFGISARTVEKELRAGLEHCCERMGRDFIQRFGPGAGKTSKHHD